ncbi:helix-turn-helix domain-containing protein [Limibacter armeniacum]|uniref:helix-turn-helix domain-containing protein n=1 Tax=Limibacter armeniacum TaxID=466084 RepID=UPI002FE6B074
MKHLTYNQRKKIADGIKKNMSDAAIAREIGVHRSTVGREIKRYGGREKYSEYLAFKIALHNQRFASFMLRCPEGKGSVLGKRWGVLDITAHISWSSVPPIRWLSIPLDNTYHINNCPKNSGDSFSLFYVPPMRLFYTGSFLDTYHQGCNNTPHFQQNVTLFLPKVVSDKILKSYTCLRSYAIKSLTSKYTSSLHAAKKLWLPKPINKKRIIMALP